MKLLNILLAGLVLFILAGCGDDDDDSSTGPAGSGACDLTITMLGMTDHSCMQGASMTADQCAQMHAQVQAFGGTAVSKSACPAGAVLECPDAASGVTTYYYTPEADDTCESLAEDP